MEVVVETKGPGTVKSRLESMQAFLLRWELEGLPPDTYCPTKLNDLLEWNDPARGIYAIGSKRDINTNHHDYGDILRDIAQRIKAISGAKAKRVEGAAEPVIPPRRGYKSEKARRIEAEAELQRCRRLLDGVTDQWHRARSEHRTMETELGAVNQKLAEYRQRLQQKERENARLNRMLSKSGVGLRVVEPD
jgi:hypothetical protein